MHLLISIFILNQLYLDQKGSYVKVKECDDDKGLRFIEHEWISYMQLEIHNCVDVCVTGEGMFCMRELRLWMNQSDKIKLWDI